jgi:hypothetical protein
VAEEELKKQRPVEVESREESSKKSPPKIVIASLNHIEETPERAESPSKMMEESGTIDSPLPKIHLTETEPTSPTLNPTEKQKMVITGDDILIEYVHRLI